MSSFSCFRIYAGFAQYTLILYNRTCKKASYCKTKKLSGTFPSLERFPNNPHHKRLTPHPLAFLPNVERTLPLMGGRGL